MQPWPLLPPPNDPSPHPLSSPCGDGCITVSLSLNGVAEDDIMLLLAHKGVTNWHIDGHIHGLHVTWVPIERSTLPMQSCRYHNHAY